MISTTPPPLVAAADVRLYRQPWTFFGLSIAIPWTLWGLAAVTSRIQPQDSGLQLLTTTLALAGLFAPAAVALLMIRRDPRLLADARQRLFTLRGITAADTAGSALLLPGALLLATIVSVVVFGGSSHQFAVKTTSSVAMGAISGWVAVTLAPFVEELAWHSYGTDALTTRWSVWRTTWAFAIFWALWHIPLAAIKGSYQAEVVEVGALASANFLVSILPFMILMNWFYYRCRRNIWIPILFHLCANVGNEILHTDPDTKVIQTAILLPVCGWVMWHDRALFFTRPQRASEK